MSEQATTNYNSNNRTARELLLKSQSLQEFLQDFIELKQKQRTRFSLRSFALKLGYQNPSLLSDILKAKRKASDDFIQRVVSYLKLDTLEERYLKNLAKVQSIDDEEVKSIILENNHCIREVLLSPIALHQNLEAVDLLLIEYLRINGNLTIEKFENYWKEYFKKDELKLRLSKLVQMEVIEMNESEIQFLKLPNRFKFEERDFKSLIDLFSKLIEARKIKDNTVLVSYLSDEDFNRAKSHVLNAYHDVAILAEKAKTTAEKSKIRVFSSHQFSI